VNLSRSHAQDLALTVGRSLAGLGLVKGGVALLGSALSLNLPALLVSRAVQAVSAAWLTRLAGRSFIVYFQQGQDWGDGGLPEVLQREYDLNRREGVLKRFLEAAYRQVVEPLKQQALRLPPRPENPSKPFRPGAAQTPEPPIREAKAEGRPEPLLRRPPEAGEARDRSDRAR
jgi:hypothetical protein